MAPVRSRRAAPKTDPGVPTTHRTRTTRAKYEDDDQVAPPMSDLGFAAATTAILSSVPGTTTAEMDRRNSAQLRRNYERAFDEFGETAAVPRLLAAARAKFEKDFPKEGELAPLVVAASNGIIREFDGDRTVFSAGRFVPEEEGIRFPPENGTSRLHIVFFRVPGGQIWAIDVGSLDGIRMKKRSSDKPLVSSTPARRRAMIIEKGETVVFGCGPLEISVNPKECLCCMEKPREKTYLCGTRDDGTPIKHLVACNECDAKLTACPLCMTPKAGFEDGMGIISCVPKPQGV